MKYFKVLVILFFTSLMSLLHSYAQINKDDLPDTRLSFSGRQLTCIGVNGDSLSSIRFESEITHLIAINESQLSVQTKKATHLISTAQHQLKIEESRTPDVEPDTNNWFLFFKGDKQLLLDYSGPTFRLEYKKSRSPKSKPIRIWYPLEYTSDLTESGLKNVVFDRENQLLLFSVPGTQSFVSVSFKTDAVGTNYIQNQNSVPDACCANWFYDAVKNQVILFLKNGEKRNEYHAFAFQNGIPKADKKVGQSYYHTKDWYELGLYRGKFRSLPELIKDDNLFKNGVKYDRLNSKLN